MKTEFEHDGKIIATADLAVPLYEDDCIKIFGKDYIVYQNSHEVEIDEDGTHEKVVCTVVSEEEF